MARLAPLRVRKPVAGAVVVLLAGALVSACGGSTTPQPEPGTAGVAAAGDAEAGAATGTSYVLSAPAVAGGYPQGQPSAQLVQQVDGDLKQTAQQLGVSGTPVHAYYDDRADGAWIFYNGVTGAGFDPDHLHDLLDQPPATKDDGAGDLLSTSAVDADPGPHGGRAVCNTVLVQNAMLSTAATTCSWFTATTAAGITVVIKGDGTNTKVGFTAADVAPIMRAIRADVEQPKSR